jgi:hypothetical protein
MDYFPQKKETALDGAPGGVCTYQGTVPVAIGFISSTWTALFLFPQTMQA